MSEGIVSAQTHFSMVPNGVVGSDISDRAFRVYVSLRAYVRPDHDTFPKLSTVANRFGMSESYLKRGISELRDHGLLVIEKRPYAGGFRKVNSYFFPDIKDGKTGSDVTPPSRSDLTLPDGSHGGRPEGSDLLPPIEEEKQEEEKQEVNTSSPATRSRLFDQFWLHYPRKVGKDDARKAYKRACSRADEGVILDGACRLAADPNLPEKRFIPHPATWLNRGGWDDEALPDRNSSDKPSASQKMQDTMNRGRALQEQQLAIGNR